MDKDLDGRSQREDDSGDEFQLLIEESPEQDMNKNDENQKECKRVIQIEKDFENLLTCLDYAIEESFF